MLTLNTPALISSARAQQQTRSQLLSYLQSRIAQNDEHDSLIEQLLQEGRLRHLLPHGALCSEVEVALAVAMTYKEQVNRGCS